MARRMLFVDSDVVEGITYYYVLREALANGDEVCQSNEASSDAAGAVCDVDDDGDVDRHDVSAIFDARGTPATGPDDPMDANGDGIITVNDGRLCVLECDLEACEVPPPPPPPGGGAACGLLGIEPFLLLGLWLRRR